jgi:hypothetical protein
MAPSPSRVVVVRKRAGMIWSVSMLVDGSATVRERKTVIGSIRQLLLLLLSTRSDLFRSNSRGSVSDRANAAVAASRWAGQHGDKRPPRPSVTIAGADAVLAVVDQSQFIPRASINLTDAFRALNKETA